MVVPSTVGVGAADVTVFWDGIPSDSSSLTVRVDDVAWIGNKIGLVVQGSILTSHKHRMVVNLRGRA